MEFTMSAFARTALIWAVMTLPASAHPGGHEDGYYAPLPKPVAEPVTVVIPETYNGVLDALREHLAAAQIARTASKMVDLRKSCATMKGLATAAPGKTSALSAADASTVAAAALHLQEQLVVLTSSAETGDVAGGDAAIAAIRADLNALARFVK